MAGLSFAPCIILINKLSGMVSITLQDHRDITVTGCTLREAKDQLIEKSKELDPDLQAAIRRTVTYIL